MAIAFSLLAAYALGCSPAGEEGRVDPVCGDASGLLRVESPRLSRRGDEGRLFKAIDARRHTLDGRSRYAVTGFRRVPLLRERVPVFATRNETVLLSGWVAGWPVRRVAPRVRELGEDTWQELGWVELLPTGEQRAADVPFVSSLSPTPSRAVEIGADAYISSSRKGHAWEAPEQTLPAGSVLDVGIGVVESGAEEGDVAWRLLACEGELCECVHAEVNDAADLARSGWQDRRIDLRSFADRSVVLRFETEALGDGSEVADPGLWAEPELRLLDRDGPRAPNLLIVSLDTLGADHLGLYGYDRDTSPYIDDQLAPQATVFTRALAPATTTGPSHMTLFTSLPPSAHGVVSNLGGRPLPASMPTLAETLRGAGYVTGAVTENGAITRRLGFDRGFDRYEENLSPRMVRPVGHIEETFAKGRDFLEDVRGLPWFLFVQSYQVHHPYTPPPEYAELFEEDGLGVQRIRRYFDEVRQEFHPDLYDREIRYTDEQLRIFLTGLAEAGLLDDTIVVVLADHGEAFFEHTYLGHGADLHRETVRVPLIVLGPGIAAGRVVDERVGLADVMPTVLELLDVAPPSGIVGRSFASKLQEDEAPGEDPHAEARPIFSEAWQVLGVARGGRVDVDQPTLAVERGSFKLIRYREGGGHRYVFFDLSTDPYERTDLLANGQTPEGAAGEALEELTQLLRDYEADAARRADSHGAEPEATPAGEIDPDRLEKLRALGYVE